MNGTLHRLHHLGFATRDLDATAAVVRRTFAIVEEVGPITDEKLNADVMLLRVKGSAAIELVSGPAVAGVLRRKMALYHACYEVEDIHLTLAEMRRAGALIVRNPVEAKLFEGRLVAFVETGVGLIELLEISG